MKIIIDLPEKVLAALEKLADEENRSRKNFIENELIKIAEKKPKNNYPSRHKRPVDHN